MSSVATSRRSQRRPLSCTECARRKLRCSKTIPCSCCIDRGKADTCHREVVQVTKSSHRRRTNRVTAHSEATATLSRDEPPISPTVQLEDCITAQSHQRASPPTRFLRDASLLRVSNDTTIILEFLALGRQNILGRGNLHHVESPSLSSSQVSHLDQSVLSLPGLSFTLSTTQVRQILDYHQLHLAWMHNVIHCPTFRNELEAILEATRAADKAWLALYYAIICTTLYHADEESLRHMNLPVTVDQIAQIHDRSLELLHEAKFMINHSIPSLQAILILLQVSHNLGHSDQISILLACAIRIAQSLNLHRLGTDESREAEHSVSSEQFHQVLINREVKKRIWWALVRQDWLQIPFQNTYSIHITQFNTPMPLNYHEDVGTSIDSETLADNPVEVFTQSSYTNVLNQISVVVWRHQDRLVTVGHPDKSSDGLSKLYEQVLVSDAELRGVWRQMPSFLREENAGIEHRSSLPPDLRRIHKLSMAHKMFTIHRHFQLQAFNNNWYAYTQMTCVNIAQASLRDIENWLLDSTLGPSRKMWTVVTHIVSCCVMLVFALIFNRDGTLVHNVSEFHRLVSVGRDTIARVEGWSTIADRGGKLIDVLVEFQQAMSQGKDMELSVEDIINFVKGDNRVEPSGHALEEPGTPFTTTWDSMLAFMFDTDSF